MEILDSTVKPIFSPSSSSTAQHAAFNATTFTVSILRD